MNEKNLLHDQGRINQVIQRDLAWAQAHLDLDLVAIEQILSDNFQQRQLDGTYKSKADLLSSYSSGNRSWVTANSTDHHVQLAGSLAILIGRWFGKGINSGKSFNYAARFLSIYQIEGETWKMILDVSIPET